MSTILYEDDRFLRVCETLTNKRGKYAWAFRYPKGWQTAMTSNYKEFADNLRLANIKAYNSRYEDAKEPECSQLDFNKGVLAYTDMEMYIVLSSISYNIDDASVNGCAEILTRIIAAVAGDIITRLPEHEKCAERLW